MKKIGKGLLIVLATILVMAGILLWTGYRFTGNELVTALTSKQGQAWTTAQAPIPTQNTRPGRWYLQVSKQTWHLERKHCHLQAKWIQTNQHKTVILLPGYGQRQSAMYQYAYFFAQAGYNVLLVDSSGQGKSGGQVSFGYQEKRDLQAWAKLVARRAGSNNQTVVLGVSMRAATALQATSLKLPQVKAIVADSAYTSFAAELKYQAAKTLNLPIYAQNFIISAANQASVRQDGFSLNQTDARPALRKNKLPILFIHGLADTFVPASMSRANYHADHGAKQLWLVPEAEHIQALSQNEALYEQRVLAFCQLYVK
ncbi:MAG: alpha/beta hydrolase [Lactobacillus sp.]|jgi:pimeloyl-ACP methyl ester carboxylesterase|nr:alpha/beta hydrolase [Lactobacillus sp.]